MEILLISDGSRTAEKNARILSEFQFPESTRYYVLEAGVEARLRKGKRSDISGLQQTLERKGYSCNMLSEKAEGEEALLGLVHEREYDLVVDLRRRKKGTAFRFGQMSSKLANEIGNTLLLADPAPESLDRILLCSGGEVYSEATIRNAANWLRYTSAEVRILHVMSQVTLDVAHPSEELEIGAQDAIEHDTREGIHLKRGMRWLEDAGLDTEIVPVLRHGLVLEEILAELKECDYGMVVVGAHIRAESRLLNILLEDITDKLITRVRIPFLIARIDPSDLEQQAPEIQNG